MSVSTKTPISMSVAEFMAWEPGDGLTWQLVDGEPRPIAPNNRTQGALIGELCGLVGNHLRSTGSACSGIVRPGIVPRVFAGRNVRIPDIAVACSSYVTEQALLEDPLLVIEILSPSNQSETWANVWTYMTIPSVREILVLRSATIGAELLRRAPDGTWPAEPATVTDGDLVLESIGLSVPLAEIYVTTRLAQDRSAVSPN